MLELTYTHGFAEAKTSATVCARPEEVRQIAKEWAKDVGWEIVGTGNALLLFHLGFSLVLGGIDVEVSAHASADGTRVQVLARARSLYPSMSAEMERTAEAFANGIFHELALRGAAVSPSRMATARQDRSRLKARNKSRRPLHWVLLAVLVPIPVLVGVLTQNPFFAIATYLWLMGAVMAEQIDRLRAIGMRAGMQIGVVLGFVVGMALVGSIAGAFY